MIITIDGPSGTGKSTVAKRVAAALGFTYCDTGAMFRTIAYGIFSSKVDPLQEDSVKEFLKNNAIEVKLVSGKMHFFLKGIDVTEHLRSREVTEIASKIATIRAVRERLKELQKEIGKQGKCVFEGRDMGTEIFPKAEVKIFLTAEPAIRAERRYKELIEKDPKKYAGLTKEEILSDINERDERDSNRKEAPLKAAADAHILDTSHLTIDQVIDKILVIVKNS